MERRPPGPRRVAARLGEALARLGRMPRGARLAIVGGLLALAFAAVVSPLFSSGGGHPVAEVAGQLPIHVSVGQSTRADLAVDNTGDASIYPVCLVMTGGARLISANFQGLDQVSASGNRVCGGQLAAQQTISITIVFAIDHAGNVAVGVAPQQGGVALGSPLVQVVSAS